MMLAPPCPKCGEDRQIEVVQTGPVTVYLCGTCAHHWKPPAA